MSYTSENVSAMSQVSLQSAGDQLKLYINGNCRATLARGSSNCINLYVNIASSGYDVYYEVGTSAHGPTDENVRKITATNGNTNFTMNGGTYGDIPIIEGTDDIRYGSLANPVKDKFNLKTSAFVVCIKYLTYNWGTTRTPNNRNTASIKITTPNAGGENSCANLSTQSFCYCSSC